MAAWGVMLVVAPWARTDPQGRRSGRRLRTYLFLGFSLVGTLPAMVLVAVLTERQASEQRRFAAAEAQEAAVSTCQSVDEYLDKHRKAINNLAANIAAAGRLDSDFLNDQLARTHAVYDGFLTMLAADAEGRLIGADPLTSATGESVLGLVDTVSDRPYFRQPMRTGRPYVSQVFRGRGFGEDAIVAVSAPLNLGGDRPQGVVEGSLDLSRLERFTGEGRTPEGAATVILDQRLRVIYACSETRYPVLSDLSGSPLLAAARQASRAFAYAEPVGEELIASRFLVAHATTEAGWTVFIRVPLARIEAGVHRAYMYAAAWFVAVMLLSLALAVLIGRRVTRPLESLVRAVRELKIETGLRPLPAMWGVPLEVRQLLRDFEGMAGRLGDSYQRLERALEEGELLRGELESVTERQEQEIRARTAELVERTYELETANRTLEHLASSDGLTGLANHRRFIDHLDQCWRIAVREKASVSLVMADIDYFKAYNDTYGHLQGDECLRRVAQVLEGVAQRPLDLAARYGGEEFALILFNTMPEVAMVLAERVRRAVEKLAVPHAGSTGGPILTISAGVAALVPAMNVDPSGLVVRADEALYCAKTKGRNRVERYAVAA